MNARYCIGIDASRSVTDQPTGTELYSRLLIDALLDRAPDRFAFRLYFNQPPRFRINPQRSEIRNLRFARLWTHVRLSSEMALHPPDVLFVPSHVLPIIHPRRSVVTVHDLGYHYFPETHPSQQRWYLDVTTRWHTVTAARVLADSQATKRDLIDRYGARPDRITVAYPGLDPSVKRVDDPAEIARVKAKYGIEGAYVLYLGTLQPRKNLSRLIAAYRKSACTWPLVLAGKRGWYYEQLIKEAGNGVRFIGYVDEADKAALLSGAEAFAFPSLYEGFGFPVLEAMACGVPVLCSNTSSLPEVAGEAALQVDPLNVDEIAAGLRRITLDTDLRRTLIERGLRQAQRFTWSACADVVLGVFEEVLTG
ncbi:MAG TPA: glycosyltransferase family 1 protein [Anaerolineae bacterium]|nr:glycosyltransferase family 1 protein [Anaerolineae bacterium]